MGPAVSADVSPLKKNADRFGRFERRNAPRFSCAGKEIIDFSAKLVQIFEEKFLTCEKYYGIVSIPLEEALFCVQFFAPPLLQNREGGYINNGGAVMRVKVTLACTECKQRNYNTMKNKKNTPDKLEMNKYCRFCKKHTLHKETK